MSLAEISGPSTLGERGNTSTAPSPIRRLAGCGEFARQKRDVHSDAVEVAFLAVVWAGYGAFAAEKRAAPDFAALP